MATVSVITGLASLIDNTGLLTSIAAALKASSASMSTCEVVSPDTGSALQHRAATAAHSRTSAEGAAVRLRPRRLRGRGAAAAAEGTVHDTAAAAECCRPAADPAPSSVSSITVGVDADSPQGTTVYSPSWRLARPVSTVWSS